VERLLAGETVAGTDPDDAWKLLNYRAAFECVTTYLNDGGAITEGLIRKIHRWLVAEVRGGSVAPSEYRRVQNYPTVRFAYGGSDEGGRSEWLECWGTRASSAAIRPAYCSITASR
jgi:hypothetical protein